MLNLPKDARSIFASIVVIGFISLTGIMLFVSIPDENLKTVDSAMAALGAAVGAAVMALLRTDKTDEIKADNTSKAFDTIRQAQSVGTQQTEQMNVTAEQVTVEKEMPKW